MAVSSSSDFTITKRQLLERSYRMVGALRSGESADAAKMSDGSIVLNSLIRELDLKRIGLWMMKESSFSTIAGTTSYTSANGLPTDILRLESGIYVVSSNDERRLEVSGYLEYDKINDKTTRGDPIKIFLSDESDLSQRTAKLWPVPDAAKTVRIRYRRRVYDFDNDSDNPDFPGEWFSCLAFLLAAEIVEEYSTDNDKVTRIYNQAQLKLREMKAGSTKSTDNPQQKDHKYY